MDKLLTIDLDIILQLKMLKAAADQHLTVPELVTRALDKLLCAEGYNT